MPALSKQITEDVAKREFFSLEIVPDVPETVIAYEQFLKEWGLSIEPLPYAEIEDAEIIIRGHFIRD